MTHTVETRASPGVADESNVHHRLCDDIRQLDQKYVDKKFGPYVRADLKAVANRGDISAFCTTASIEDALLLPRKLRHCRDVVTSSTPSRRWCEHEYIGVSCGGASSSRCCCCLRSAMLTGPTRTATDRIKRLCGLGKGDIPCNFPDPDRHAFQPRMPNPMHSGQSVWFCVCSDHTLKVSAAEPAAAQPAQHSRAVCRHASPTGWPQRLVRAGYESMPGRKRMFQRKRGGNMQPFTWQAIVAVWRWDQQNLDSRRTALRRDAVFRDGFSDLRVWVALAVLNDRVLASLRTIKDELAASQLPAERASGCKRATHSLSVSLPAWRHRHRPPRAPHTSGTPIHSHTQPTTQHAPPTQTEARGHDEMYMYLRQLQKAFCGFFLNNKAGEARIKSVADLARARSLYEWLR